MPLPDGLKILYTLGILASSLPLPAGSLIASGVPGSSKLYIDPVVGCRHVAAQR